MSGVNFLACPVDGLILNKQNQSFVCSNGHNYDIARPNYINLLLVQHKSSRQPGDNKEMVAARAQFLNSGIYQPLLHAIYNTVASRIPQSGNILDIACGEGYYLQGLKEKFNKSQCLGVDISKWAIKSASKRTDEITWVVGNSKKLPVVDSQIDLAMCVFGYPHEDELLRVLKPRGLFLLVEAGPDHLLELRLQLYPQLKTNQPPSPYEQLDILFDDHIYYKHKLTTVDLNHLIKMTPHYYRAPKDRLQSVLRQESLHLSFQFHLRLFTKMD